MMLFGVVALLAGFLSLLFPETMGSTLPDSVEEAAALGSPSSSSLSDTDQQISPIPQVVVTQENSS
jgi:hypothetical protein